MTKLRALKSLSLTWQFDDVIVQQLIGRGPWTFPTTLTHLNLSEEQRVNARAPIPPTLKVLNLSHNKLAMLSVPFLPMVQVLDASFYSALGADAWPELWINALPASFRTLDIQSYRIDEEMGVLFVTARERIGDMAAGVAKLHIVTDEKIVDVYDGDDDDLLFSRFERSTIEALVSAKLVPQPKGNSGVRIVFIEFC